MLAAKGSVGLQDLTLHPSLSDGHRDIGGGERAGERFGFEGGGAD